MHALFIPQAALETVGIEPQSREDMLTVLTAVLQIGNMTFEEHETTEAAAVTDEAHAKFVAQLLMVAEDSLTYVGAPWGGALH